MKACLANAVDHSQKPETLEIEVGSVVLCPGSEPYDPSKLENVYHYKESPNVVTSLEFERILSASGPTMGHLKRPSDDKVNLQIARRVEEVVNLVHSEGSVLRFGFQDHE